MSADDDLERRSELADAKLGVAEDLAWAVAVLAAIATHLKWESWLFTVPVAIAAYFIATFSYRREASKAENEYFRSAGLGKHVGQRKVGDA